MLSSFLISRELCLASNIPPSKFYVSVDPGILRIAWALSCKSNWIPLFCKAFPFEIIFIFCFSTDCYRKHNVSNTCFLY